MRVKALVVKPPNRSDWDFGDVLAVARAEGKKLFKTEDNIKIVWMQPTPYGVVVVVTRECAHGCNQTAGCKRRKRRNE